MMTMEKFKHYCFTATSRDVVVRALKVSFVVGSALNLINQGEYIVTLEVAELHLSKIFLTYLVPYGVATYSAMVMKFELEKKARI